MNSTIYVKGDPGFKAAVLAKLGTWIHGIEDSDEHHIGFSIPENILLDDFKEAIGNKVILEYHLLFLDEPLEPTPLEGPWKFIPGSPIKMSIWANKDYHLGK